MCKFLLPYQENRFKDILYKAKELLEEICRLPEFSEIYIRTKCHLLSYVSKDEAQPLATNFELNVLVLHWILQLWALKVVLGY
jgi:hypothetical protein